MEAGASGVPGWSVAARANRPRDGSGRGPAATRFRCTEEHLALGRTSRRLRIVSLVQKTHKSSLQMDSRIITLSAAGRPGPRGVPARPSASRCVAECVARRVSSTTTRPWSSTTTSNW
uniref:(northern house mosquito) hypothetical protein n=1 Tax=Culex pipiens TaxID=7175 RepID=A0A8D8PGM6_CULPI